MGAPRIVVLVAQVVSLLRSWIHSLFYGGDGLATNPPIAGASKMTLCGHRGGSSAAPENSVASFKWAFDHGFPAIEFDLQRTFDNKIIVLHDTTLARTGSIRTGSGPRALQLLNSPVDQLQFKDILTVDIGTRQKGVAYSRERVQTFSSVLDKFLKKDRVMVVELKGSDPKLVQLATMIARNHSEHKRIRWAGFDLNSMVLTKSLMGKDSQVYWLQAVPPCCGGTKRIRRIVDLAKAAGLDGIDINADSMIVNIESVGYAHSQGLEFFTWAYDGQRETAFLFNHLVSAGVDLYTSNLPPELLKWRSHHQNKL